MKLLSILTIAVAICMSVAGSASANSRFQVESNTTYGLKLDIFTGHDSMCSIPEKNGSMDARTTKGFGCTGQGQNRCQIFIMNRKTGKLLCSAMYFGTCKGGKAISIPNGSKLVVQQMGNNHACTLYDKNDEVIAVHPDP